MKLGWSLSITHHFPPDTTTPHATPHDRENQRIPSEKTDLNDERIARERDETEANRIALQAARALIRTVRANSAALDDALQAVADTAQAQAVAALEQLTSALDTRESAYSVIGRPAEHPLAVEPGLSSRLELSRRDIAAFVGGSIR